MSTKQDIALIGLAVMGQNLVLNMDDHGIKVAVYNRTAQKMLDFVNGSAANTAVKGAESLEELVGMLSVPRKIMMLVKAGDAVDQVIEQLLPLLDKGDVIIDGGNSNFEDSERRAKNLSTTGIHYIGMGVSGGEEGARNGPSLMPGGHADAWPLVKDMFQSIAAKTDNGEPCCDWVGDNGAGHFVKMVHNGIEYGDMQLICEAYHFMRSGMGLPNAKMHEVFSEWDKGKLDSYLIEITADILGYQENGEYVVDTVLDRAGQKGTGKWTGINALELGIPLTLIGEAVFARCLSAIKEERVRASKMISGPDADAQTLPEQDWINPLGDALYASKIISYAQGFMLMRAAAEEYDWTLDYGAIAQMWRGGCIIRSAFLDDIKAAFDKNAELENLLQDDFFREEVENAQANWRTLIAKTIEIGIPTPAMSSAIAFFDGYRTASLPANLLQAQRDYFGAHTYQKVGGDGSFHHTDWIGSGGGVTSNTYNA
jgi:6-phosphogluconate dehydrogenase